MRIFQRRQAKGASLIEILIALIVISVGMIGSAALQVAQLRQITQANAEYMAGFQLIDIMDSMEANRIGVLAGKYANLNFSALALEDETSCTTTNCAPEVIAKNDAIRWAKKVSALLPNGTLSIALKSGTTSTYIISIQWTGQTHPYTREITF